MAFKVGYNPFTDIGALTSHFKICCNIFFIAYWTFGYIAPCIVFYMYDCAFVTFFIT